MRKDFCLETIPEIGGGAARAAFNVELARCFEDMRQREREMGKRIVTLAVEMEPDEKDEGVVNVTFKTSTKIPKQSTSKARMLIKYNTNAEPRLVFQTEDKDSPRQLSIDEIKNNGGEVPPGTV